MLATTLETMLEIPSFMKTGTAQSYRTGKKFKEM